MIPELRPYSHMLQIFDKLPHREWSHFQERKFAPKEIILPEGSMAHMNLYLILKGICVAAKNLHDDDSYFASYKICAGQFTGLRELLRDFPAKRPVTILAKTPVIALEIRGNTFRSWQTNYGTTYNEVIRAVLNQQFSSRRLMVNCVLKDSLAAGGYYICHLYEAYRTSCYPPGHADYVKLWDTRAEIAMAIGRNIRSVDRIISTYQEQGLLRVYHGKIHMNLEQYHNMQAMLD